MKRSGTARAILPCLIVLACGSTACGSTDETRLYTDPQLRALPLPLVDGVGVDELQKMQDYVNGLVKPETISNSVYMGGDEFDCVFVDRQPTIEKMRDNGEDVSKILEQLDPIPDEQRSEDQGLPKYDVLESSVQADAVPGAELKATVLPPREATQPVEEYCPKGTIPVRRIPLKEVAVFPTLDKYLQSLMPILRGTPATGYDHSVLYRTSPVDTFGMRATVNVWNTYHDAAADHTNSQLWLGRGSGYGVDYDSVEVGVDTLGSGGSIAKLFIFFTNSNYSSGSTNCSTSNCSCHNLGCGFIQTDNTVFIGGTLSPASISGGQQYEVTLSLLKIYDFDNWHVMYGGKWVGYWPHENFFHTGGIQDHGNGRNVSWGGEVFDSFSLPSHTDTMMGGDGSFGCCGAVYGHAAYQRNLMTIDTRPSGTYTFVNAYTGVDPVHPIGLSHVDQRPDCYTSGYGVNDPNWGAYLYHGGPGLSYACQARSQ